MSVGSAGAAGAVSEGAARQFLLFEAGGRFGLWSSLVREAIRAVAVTPLPHAPAAILGVFNLRGRVVPLLDLRARFHFPPKDVQPSDHFIIALAGGRIAAFHADRAVGLVDVGAQDVETATAATSATEYLDGIVKLPDGLVLIHDPASFLSGAESAGLDRALGARG